MVRALMYIKIRVKTYRVKNPDCNGRKITSYKKKPRPQLVENRKEAGLKNSLSLLKMTILVINELFCRCAVRIYLFMYYSVFI